MADDIRRRSTLGGRPDVRLQAAIFAGGALGALARTELGRALGGGHGWPWATFAANVAGCLLLGWVVTRLQERLPPSTYRRPLLATGFCGALTTFSTFQVELLGMAREHRPGLLAGYVAASLAAGYGSVLLATRLTRARMP